jgi:hypothetical protein
MKPAKLRLKEMCPGITPEEIKDEFELERQEDRLQELTSQLIKTPQERREQRALEDLTRRRQQEATQRRVERENRHAFPSRYEFD